MVTTDLGHVAKALDCARAEVLSIDRERDLITATQCQIHTIPSIILHRRCRFAPDLIQGSIGTGHEAKSTIRLNAQNVVAITPKEDLCIDGVVAFRLEGERQLRA